MNIWHDHPAAIRKALNERYILYIPIHVVLSYIILNNLHLFAASSWNTQSFLDMIPYLFTAGIYAVLFYIVFLMPIRICRHDNPEGWICSILAILTLGTI